MDKRQATYKSTITRETVLDTKLENHLAQRKSQINLFIESSRDAKENNNHKDDTLKDVELCNKENDNDSVHATTLDSTIKSINPEAKEENEEEMKKKDMNARIELAIQRFLKNRQILETYTLNKNDLVKRVYYNNNLQAAHARIIVETDSVINNRISFSYGQSGIKKCFTTHGFLTIENFKHIPECIPNSRDCYMVEVDHPDLTSENAVMSARYLFASSKFDIFNYWSQNCYTYADMLFEKLTGKKCRILDWFVKQIRAGKKFVGDTSSLGIYGDCPY